MKLLEGIRAIRAAKTNLSLAADEEVEAHLRQRLVGLSVAEKATLYSALQRDDRNFVREIEDQVMAGLRFKGIVSFVGGAVDPWATPFIIPTRAWVALGAERERLFPPDLLDSAEFKREFDKAEAARSPKRRR